MTSLNQRIVSLENGNSGISQSQLDTKQDVLSAGDNISIVGDVISSSLPTTASFSTISSNNIDAVRLDVSDRVVITQTSPTLYLKDTNDRAGMIHMNASRMYFLSGAANSETWSQVNGQWPLYIQTDTNAAVFGGTITTPNIETAKFNGYDAIITVAIAKLDESGTTLYAKGCTVTRTGAGQYRCNFSSTMPTLDYVVHLTSMEGTNRGDIIILFKQGTALTTRFEYYIVEQDNGTTAGVYVDKPHFISVFV
jgi:hypothetical protein